MVDIKELQEEVFCVGYEARIFAGYINYGRIERWIPNFTDYVTEDSHMKRYALACRYTENKSVLDIASGSGRGAFMIADEGKAASVLGIDIDKDALRYANHRYKNDKIKFENGNASAFFEENAFDVIVSFETVEHLVDIEGYFICINKSLKNEGLLFISTPISSKILDNNPKSIYHVREWGYSSFQEEVAKYMNIKEIYLQLYPYRNNSLMDRVKKKIMRMLGIPYPQQQDVSTIFKLSDLPVTVKKNTIGTKHRGYQILMCTKNTGN